MMTKNMQVNREDLTVLVFTTVVRKETKDQAIKDLYQLGGDGNTFMILAARNVH